MATTDDIFKTVSDLTKEGGKYAKDLFDKGYDKAKTLTELAKLNYELVNQKRTLDRLYIELGKLYYSNRQPSENERIKAVCSKIDFGKDQIEDIEEKLENLKYPKTDESAQTTEGGEGGMDTDVPVTVICPECRAENPAGEQFCIGCGILLKK